MWRLLHTSLCIVFIWVAFDARCVLQFHNVHARDRVLLHHALTTLLILFCLIAPPTFFNVAEHIVWMQIPLLVERTGAIPRAVLGTLRLCVTGRAVASVSTHGDIATFCASPYVYALATLTVFTPHTSERRCARLQLMLSIFHHVTQPTLCAFVLIVMGSTTPTTECVSALALVMHIQHDTSFATCLLMTAILSAMPRLLPTAVAVATVQFVVSFAPQSHEIVATAIVAACIAVQRRRTFASDVALYACVNIWLIRCA